MQTSINRKERQVTFKIGDSAEVKSFEETWAFVYLLMRKMASSHRA